MISGILSEKEAERKNYEGFEIISNSLDNTLTREQLVAAINIMWELVMETDKNTRDNKYLFNKGVLQFHNAFEANKNKEDFEMTDEQLKKVKTKVKNIKPLLEFLIKMKDVIK